MVDSELSLPANVVFTIDGGYLLHKIPWTRPATFGNICDHYVQYVLQKYDQNRTVVFDGSKSSIKDEDISGDVLEQLTKLLLWWLRRNSFYQMVKIKNLS